MKIYTGVPKGAWDYDVLKAPPSAWSYVGKGGSATVAGTPVQIVGGSVLEDAAHARDGLGRDIPITKEALALQDKLLALADSLGIGPEFRTIYFNVQGGVLIGATAGVALGAGFAAGAIGGAIVGAVVGIVSVFADDDEETDKAVKRAARTKKKMNELFQRLDLNGFALEQERVATGAAIDIPAIGIEANSDLVARASRLAQFYRKANANLSAKERAVFISSSNIARWRSGLQSIEDMPYARRMFVSFAVGEDPSPVLEGKIAAEQKVLTKATAALGASTEEESGIISTRNVVVLGLAVAGGLAAYYPAAAMTIGRMVAGYGAMAVTKVRGLV